MHTASIWCGSHGGVDIPWAGQVPCQGRGPIAGEAVWRDNEDTLITLQGWGGDETHGIVDSVATGFNPNPNTQEPRLRPWFWAEALLEPAHGLKPGY